MCNYVEHILVPYLDPQKTRLSLQTDHECIFQINVWSVHKSLAFQTWLNIKYLYIIIDYVPGGCTPLFQPYNLGIQHPIKLSIKHSQHANLVHKALSLLEEGKKPEDLKLCKATFRDHAPAWLVKAHHAVNKPCVIKNVRLHLV
jgi:hypothetical protein